MPTTSSRPGAGGSRPGLIRAGSSAPSGGAPTGSVFTASAASAFALGVSATEIKGHDLAVRASASFGFQDRALDLVGRSKPVAAASAIVLHVNARDPDNPNVLVGAGSVVHLVGTATPQQDRAVAAGVGFAMGSGSAAKVPANFAVAATAPLVLTARARGTVPANLPVGATVALSLADRAQSHNTAILASARSSVALVPAADVDADRLFGPAAATGLTLADRASATVAAIRVVSATTAIGLADRAVGNGVHVLSASSGLVLAASAHQGRDIHVAAISSVGLGLSEHIAPLWSDAAHSSVLLADQAHAVRAGLGGVGRITFRDGARASVALPGTAGTPGGLRVRSFAGAATPLAVAPSRGLRTVLRAGVSGDFPCSFAETPSGLVLIANGVDPMLRWDGMTGAADTAGVVPPRLALMLGGIGAGTIVGERVAYQRFIDLYGNPSILSPVSNTVEFGRDGLIDAVLCDPTSGLVTIRSEAHGLAHGDPVVISGVDGMAQLNGTWMVGVAAADTFTLVGITAIRSTFAGRGSWTLGVGTVVYSDVEIPAEAKVVRRQLLRNLSGNGDVFYVDIDTTDLASTVFMSALDDETLSGREAVPLLTEDDIPFANRYYPPPSSKALVAAHMGRIFAAGDVTVRAGWVTATFGSNLVTGLGTDFRAAMAARSLYIPGASKGYEIASVDVASQTLTLVESFADAVPGPGPYAIRPPQGERKLVYYTEPNLHEVWPPWNAIAVPEDGDDITGLMQKDSFLFILETRHIYKYTLQSDPATDGFLFLTTQRGVLNNRCHIQVEGSAYLLDDVGIHRFDGGQSEAISTPIQPLFQQGIGLGGVEVNWSADRSLWHAALDPVRETARWFVSMSGDGLPRHAICYDYRRSRWWVEEYPQAMTSSVVSTIGYRRSLAGTDGGRVVCLSEGSLDLADPSVGGLARVGSAGPLSLVDPSARFADDLAGAPVSIARGKGSGQQRRIVASSASRLEIDRPWRVLPDATSSYQVGGVHWRWDSGWYRYAEDEYQNPRDVEVIFQPLAGAASMDVQLFHDHATAPRLWAYTAADDGVATTAGSSRITIDLSKASGYAIQRMAGHRASYAEGDRFVSARLSGVQGPEPTRVYQVTLNGAQ